MKTVNKVVACVPPETVSLKTEVKNGLALIQQKRTLTFLEVLFDSEKFKKGQKVGFRSEILRHPWIKEVLEINETKFVVLPEDQVISVLD